MLGVILAEMHSSEIWTLKDHIVQPRRAPSGELMTPIKPTIFSPNICPDYKKCRHKDDAKNEAMAKLWPA